MATTIRFWEVRDGILADLITDVDDTTEKQVEDWIESSPEAVSDDLLIIGRQAVTDSGPLDLLGVLGDGRLVVIELKRDRLPRLVVAQAIDYASWVAQQPPEWVNEIGSEYLSKKAGHQVSLQQVYEERFHQQFVVSGEPPAVRVVGTRLDASTERMVEHLANRYRMDINGVVLRHVRVNGADILARTAVYPDAPPTTEGTAAYRVASPVLDEMAASRGVSALLQHLRALRGVPAVFEQPARTYGGSFRYFAGGRVVFGINVANEWGAPDGVVDVWVRYGALSEQSGETTEVLRGRFATAGFEPLSDWAKYDQTVYRLDTVERAKQFAELIRDALVVAGNSPDMASV